MPLMRLIYFSENQINPDDGSVIRSLAQILDASNRNNRPADLTGALIFDDMWFVQALEGDRKVVWDTFQRIQGDDRHDHIVIAEFVSIESRTFGSWWMGLATRSIKTDHIFQQFLKDGKFDPRRMSAFEMLSLMMDLARLGLSRELAMPRAA